MPSDYTGDPAGIAAHQAPVIAIPVGTDAANSNSVNVPFKKLADFAAQLMRDAALLGVANTITAENAFTDANPLRFMRSGDQTLTKDVAGVLSIVNLVHAVVIRAGAGHNAQLLSAGGALIQATPAEINVNGFPITGVADPTYDQDVATKAYVDRKGLVASTSAPCVSYTVGGTMAQVTNLSVGVTTNSRPVVLQIQPDGVNGGADMRIDAGATLSIRILRDGTEIAKWFFGNGGTLAYGPMPPAFLDVAPGTGTRTYTVEAQASSGSARIDGVVLAAFTL